MLKNSICVLLVIVLSGCTSFRTTVLHRFSNDSVKPQNTNRKLKGLPVKLKVPSHLQVTIYEEQVILANGDDADEQLKKDAEDAAKAVLSKKNELKGVNGREAAAQKRIASILGLLEAVKKKKSDLPRDIPNYGEQVAALDIVIKKMTTDLAEAEKEVQLAIADLVRAPDLERQIQDLEQASDLASRTAAIGYTLVSFTPAQFHVESELQYTDKIFLVDFKRPAAGILDLKGASMDDEQYFSEVRAEVTERTLSDIGDALTTVGGAVTKLKPTKATPVSSDTPSAEENTNVNFQKSVIASKRFDISESGWEQRMRDFVNEHLGRSDLIGDLPQSAEAVHGYPLEGHQFEAYYNVLPAAS